MLTLLIGSHNIRPEGACERQRRELSRLPDQSGRVRTSLRSSNRLERRTVRITTVSVSIR